MNNSQPPGASPDPSMYGVTPEQIERFVQACPVKAAVSGVMGGMFGYAVGAFFGGSPNMDHLNPDAPKLSTWQHVKAGFKDSHERGSRMSRSFAVAGAVFVTFECLIEKKRGKSDMWNPILGGCAAGAALGVRGGPTGMALGCAGFAAFSGIIEVLLDHD